MQSPVPEIDLHEALAGHWVAGPDGLQMSAHCDGVLEGGFSSAQVGVAVAPVGGPGHGEEAEHRGEEPRPSTYQLRACFLLFLEEVWGSVPLDEVEAEIGCRLPSSTASGAAGSFSATRGAEATTKTGATPSLLGLRRRGIPLASARLPSSSASASAAFKTWRTTSTLAPKTKRPVGASFSLRGVLPGPP